MSRPQRNRILTLGDGYSAIDRFVQELQRFKRSANELARVRRLALELVDDLPPNAELDEIRALFGYVRDVIRYTKDVRNVDTLQTPTATLDTLSGDCDDKALLLSALLESIGYATRFAVAATVPNASYNHVFVEVLNPRSGQWIPLEASVPNFPFGRALRSFEPLRRYA